MQHRFRMKWWGWGSNEQKFNIDDRPGILPYLKKHFGIKRLKKTQFDLNDLVLPQSNLAEEIIATFKSAFGDQNCTNSKEEIISHAFGKSYYDLLRVRSLKVNCVPDLVVYPESEEQIQKIIKLCEQYKIALIPFGGGTSVANGILAAKGKQLYAISVDLSKMKKILSIDLESMTANIEAGIFGPELEELLQKDGYTLGHFPQSFEFSTLGGWIATRSSGQNSIYYGGIEKMLVSLRVVTPKGMIETLEVPRMAAGPDLKEILTGSEGRYGIITSARIKITQVPELKKYFLYFFPDFKAATAASRIARLRKSTPHMIRISDENETEGLMAMGGGHKSFKDNILSSLIKKYMLFKGFNLNSYCSVMVGFEGDLEHIETNHFLIDDIYKENGAICLGSSPGDKWLKDRFFMPYLRDDFMNQNLFIDTLETCTTWKNIHTLYDEVRKAICSSLEKDDRRFKVFCHVSHIYREGASLYFTIIGNQDPSAPLEQWEKMKEAVNTVIRINKGSPSHHHGIGIDHKSAMYFTGLDKEILETIKDHLDPNEILNPEKLL